LTCLRELIAVALEVCYDNNRFMELSERHPAEKEQRPKAWVTFGAAGHEKEYILVVEHEGEEFLPYAIAPALEQELGDAWWVSDRGTRIEIVHKNPYGLRDDATVTGAIGRVLGGAYRFAPVVEG